MKRKPLIILASIVALLLILTLAAPWVVKYQLRQQLLALGARQAQIESLYLNIWSGHFHLRNLSARGADGTALEVGYLETDLEMGALFKRRLYLDHLYLYDSRIPLIQAGALWALGPLQLPTAAPDAEPAAGEPSRWHWGLSTLQLKNLILEARLPDATQRLEIDRGTLNLLQNWLPDQESQLNLSGRLNGSPFAIGSTATPLARLPKASTHLTIDHLALGPLSAPWVAGLSGDLSADLALSIAGDGHGWTLGREGLVTLARFGLARPDLALSGDSLRWQGRSQLHLADTLSAETDGELALAGVTLTQGERTLRLKTLDLSGPLTLSGEADRRLNHRGTLSLAGLNLDQPGLTLTSDRLRWKGTGDVRLAADAPPRVATDGELTLETLALALPELQVREQQLDLGGTLDTDLQRLAFEGHLDTRPATLTLPRQELATARRHWQGRVEADLEGGALTSLDGELELGQLVLRDRQAKPLATLERLALPRFEVGAGLAFKAPSLALGPLQLGGQTPLLNLSGVTASNLSGDPASLAVERLELDALDTGVTLDTQGQPRQWLDWLARLGPAVGETTASRPEAPAKAPPFRVRIDRLSLRQPANLAFKDSTVKPARDLTTTLNRLALNGIDTGATTPVGFDLAALINRYGNLTLKGRYAAFADDPDGRWQGHLKQLELPPFSPYMQRHSGYQLRSGQLSLDSSGTLVKGRVDSQNQVLIHNLQVRKRAEQDAGAFDQELGMPLTTAIAILTDDEDNLALDIPVKGSVNDPQFGYQSVVKIIMTKVAKEGAVSYLTSALQPYGALITLTRMAMKAGNAINLEPVAFAPGSAELDAQAQDYLNKLQGMMAKRDGIRLNLCGLAVAADAEALQAQFRARQLAALQQNPPAASGADVSPPPMPAEALDGALRELAENRGDRVKNYLLALPQIDPERLFGCLPSVDLDSDKRPQVKLGL